QVRRGGGPDAQTRGSSPARGGHFLKYPSPCLVFATNWLNELMPAYSPRNRSSTEANRNTPVPTYFCSSNSTATSMPRQKPLAGPPPVRPITRRVHIAV